MKNRSLKMILFFLFCAFLNVQAQTTSKELIEMETADRVANHITKIFSKKMYAEKGLVTIGVGGGAVKGSGKGLRMLSVTMECYQMCNIQQARKLLLECVNEYVAEINKHEEFKKYAHPFPFDFKNVSISILFTDKTTGMFYSPPRIATADALEGEFSYGTAPDPEGLLETVGEETYTEALCKSI